MNTSRQQALENLEDLFKKIKAGSGTDIPTCIGEQCGLYQKLMKGKGRNRSANEGWCNFASKRILVKTEVCPRSGGPEMA